MWHYRYLLLQDMRATLSFTRSITRGFRLRIALIILLGLLGVFFTLAFVWCSKQVIDIATKAREGELIDYALLLILLMALSILFRVMDIRLRRMTEVKLGNAIRYNLFSSCSTPAGRSCHCCAAICLRGLSRIAMSGERDGYHDSSASLPPRNLLVPW